MAIEEIRILPSNGLEMSFSGELITHATSDHVTTPLGDRWFELYVYRMVDSGFVPVIEYHTTVEGEEGTTVAERVDRRHDIENFYYVFEPCEVIPQAVLKVMTVEDRQRFTNSILKHYDTQVNHVLLSLKERANDDDAEVESPKSEKKGLLGFFGRAQ